MKLWTLLLVLLPSIAVAQPSAYGTVVVLKDRQAGFLEDVRRISKQVSVVRGGVESPATPGMAVYPGDAIRTAEGTAVVETPTGNRIEIAERSQLRLQPTILQRLGEVFYAVQGAFSVEVGDVQLLVEGTAFKVSSSLAGAGNLAVTEGTVRAKGAEADEAAAATSTLDFSGEGVAAPRAMTPDEVAAIAAWRTARFEPSAVAGLQRNRVHIRLNGGIGRLDEFTWGSVGLEARIRAVGPLWFDLGAAAAIRPTDELAAYETAVTLPTHVGARLVANLPGAGFLGGGADFTLLVGEHCVDAPTCRREVTAEPGVRVALLAGLLLGERFGVDIEAAGGVQRRRFPSFVEGEDPLEIPDPQIRVTVGAFVRF